MDLKVVEAYRREQPAGRLRLPPHPEYPIEQAYGSDDAATQQQLMLEASRAAIAVEETLLVPEYNGVRVLGRSEGALERAGEYLHRRFGSTLVAGEPAVRYTETVPVLEPYMIVLVNGAMRFLPHVRKDFVARRGRVIRVIERETFVFEGEAPLADLLGYRQRTLALLEASQHSSHVAMWLSRYVPVDDGGPAAA
jgi:hypothetical protein